jgi:hypothetical protein
MSQEKTYKSVRKIFDCKAISDVKIQKSIRLKYHIS